MVIIASGFQDIYLTGATYDSGTGVLSLSNTNGSIVTASGFSTGGGSSVMVAGSGAGSVLRNGNLNISSNCASTVSGGRWNTASGRYSTIGGGRCNTTSGNYSFVGGGNGNRVEGFHQFIGGGTLNTILFGTPITNDRTSILGGECNTIFAGQQSAIAGGGRNIIGSTICQGTQSFIGAGNNNTTLQPYSFIGAGFYNTVLGIRSSIISGCYNVITSADSGIIAGNNNTIGCQRSFIVGSNITTNRACATFVNNLSIMNIPTSSTGLPTGAVWRDSVTNGLFIVP